MELIVKGLSYQYEDNKGEVLNDVSFEIHKGEWVTIIGHNGSGKTTLSKLLTGLLSIKSGQVFFDDLELTENNLYEIRKHIGIIFQNPDNQFVQTSVEDDIAFGLENLKVPQEKMEEIIKRSLEKVSMLDFRKEEPSNLSGGQKQRVAIASIYAMNPDIIIFDESTSMLDPIGRRSIIDLIIDLKKEGKTIINITHNMKEAILSDRCIVLDNGSIIKNDTAINTMSDYQTLTKAKLTMPNELKLYFMLKNNGYNNEEVLSKLWELAFKM